MKSLALLALVSTLSVIALAQRIPFPSAKETIPVIHARAVHFDSLFTYTYDVGNGVGANQSINHIFILLSHPSTHVVFQEPLWRPGVHFIRYYRVFDWRAVGDAPQIYPGQPSKRFIFSSNGIPGLIDMRVHGQIPPDTLNEETEYDTTGADVLTNSVRVISLGPVRPMTEFRPLTFLDTLSSYVVQSRSMGWIVNQSTTDKYSEILSRIKTDIASCSLPMARVRIDTIIQHVNVDSTSALTSEAYALIRFNTEYLRDRLKATFQVKGGVFNPTGSALSVRAKPSSNFGSSDSLKCITGTLRWLTASNITLGTISSPAYGFTKSGSVTTAGSYSYQKFNTMSPKSLNWTAGTEYELFTVPISNPTGFEEIELTNALAGGEWFVDINYLDKTDSLSYQNVARGFIFSNKSDNAGATAFNGARHVVLSGTTFHETYQSGGEIVYRKKDLNSPNWDVTTRISSGNGSNNDPSIIVAHDGSIHAVWQRMLTSSTWAVYWTCSTNGGTTWANPITLPNASNVSINQSYQWNVYPVIAEQSTTTLVAVYCSSTGLRYATSTNLGVNWNDQGLISGTTSPGTIWYPSISRGSNFLILTYDTRYYGLYSKMYNGSWQTEQNVTSGIGTISDRHSSVVVDINNAPLAAWCAQRSGQAEYRIVFRVGNTGGGSWSSSYYEFPFSAGLSDYYPSVTFYRTSGGVNQRELLWQNSQNGIRMTQWGFGTWGAATTIGTSGGWVNESVQEGTTLLPVRIWSDQTTSPYEVKRSSSGAYQLQSMPAPTVTLEQHRRVTIESAQSGSFVSFELSPIAVVTAKGDTTLLPFKALDQTAAITSTLSDAWDYLGTENVKIPQDARFLVVNAEIQQVTRQDSTGRKTFNNAFSSKGLRVDIRGGAKTETLLTDRVAQSGKKAMDISGWAGQTVSIRPVGEATLKTSEIPVIGIGDVYVEKRRL